MRLVVSQTAEEMLRARGGRVYVWVRKGRCCGAHRTLAASTQPPSDRAFRVVARGATIEVLVPEHMAPLPDELHLDVGRFSRELQAYWNGCAWVV